MCDVFAPDWRVAQALARRSFTVHGRNSTRTQQHKRAGRRSEIGEVAMAKANAQARARHWIKTRNLTYVILALWALFGIVLPWFAKELNSFSFLGFPLGYYFCVQGSLIAFVLLIVFQNWRQDQIDDEFGVGDE
jgi:putative solute:sodium symporter small subunit